jgi:hypothetical protein
MVSDILQAAFEAGLSPLVSRIAVVVADISGTERALGFIDACRLEDEAWGTAPLEVGTGTMELGERGAGDRAPGSPAMTRKA